MHLDHSIPHLFIVTSLNALQQLDSDPLLFALHESSHDFGDAVGVKTLRLNALDVFLVFFTCLLFTWPLRNGRLPTIAIFDAKSFDGSCRKFCSPFGLCLATNEASAIGFAAVAGLRVGAVSVDIVVEYELLASFDFPLGKNSHPELVSHHPFVDIAVRTTGVIAEPAQVSFLCSIDEFAFRKGHEIEVLDSFFIVLNHAPSELRLVDDFSNIFEYEITRSKFRIRS